MGVHTCDERSTKSTIEKRFPSYRIEPGFTEQDELWSPDVRESDADRDARLLKLLREIFAQDSNTVLSLTAHSGAITSVLKVTGHREFALLTGAVIPVVLRVERV